jgi:hypothetical protein
MAAARTFPQLLDNSPPTLRIDRTVSATALVKGSMATAISSAAQGTA